MSSIKNFTLRLVFLILTLGAGPLEALVNPQIHGRDIVTGQESTVASTGKGLVVVFLSAKCPCSKSHTGELAELAREFKEFGFVGVHSNMDETEELAKAYFTELKLPFPVVRDVDAKIADRFKALKTPHAFVLAPSAETLFQGGMSDSKDCADAGRRYLREALSALREGKIPKERSVRTLGCAIVRRKNA